MTKLTILFTGSSMGLGLMTNLTALCLGLQRRGHRVVVFGSKQEQELGNRDRLLKSGIEYHESMPIEAFSILGFADAAKEMGRVLRREHFDIVHLNGTTQLMPARGSLRWVDETERPPFVTSIHTIRLRGRYESLVTALESMALNAWTRVALPVSDWTGSKLTSAGLSKTKVRTVYNSIDLEHLSSVVAQPPSAAVWNAIENTRGNRLIAFIGSLVRWKGPDDFVAAVNIIARLRQDVRFLVVGEGPMHTMLALTARRMGLADNVQFLGKLPHDETLRLLAMADIYVCSSTYENLPFSVMEAMALGKAVVATSVGGIPEMITHGRNGILVPPRNPEAIAVGVVDLLTNEDLRSKFGREARAVVERKFSTEKVLPELENAYAYAMSRVNPRT